MPHTHELVDFTVVAYIVYGSKVLLVDHKKYHTWLAVGGHIELGENPEEALLREIEEESGFKPEEIEIWGERPSISDDRLTPLLAPIYLDSHGINETHTHIGMVYFARAKHDSIKLAETEHNDIRWFTREELSDPQYKIGKWIRFCAEQALEKIGTAFHDTH